jgi:hypothetical protein
MKKALLGCAVVAVLLAVVGGTLGYFYVYRPAKQYVASFSQLQEVPKLNARIRNKAAFIPPQGGELTEAMVDRFIKTQDALRARMGTRLEELDAKYKAFDKARGEGTNQPSVAEAFEALKDLGGLIVDAKRAQVEALNQNGFSLAEYEWTRSAVYQAIGVHVTEGFEEAIRNASGDQTAMKDAMKQVMADVPEVNRKLVEPLKEKLTENMPLAFFGL